MIIDDVEYPVTTQFMAETGTPYPDLLTMHYNALTRERDSLLRLSEQWRRLGDLLRRGLTSGEGDRLQAVTRAINVHHGARVLQDRPLADLGFEGVDQVHGNAIHYPCGCKLHVLFDHHRRADPEVERHPHYPLESCAKHAGLLPDYKAHHAQVVSDHKI